MKVSHHGRPSQTANLVTRGRLNLTGNVARGGGRPSIHAKRARFPPLLPLHHPHLLADVRPDPTPAATANGSRRPQPGTPRPRPPAPRPAREGLRTRDQTNPTARRGKPGKPGGSPPPPLTFCISRRARNMFRSLFASCRRARTAGRDMPKSARFGASSRSSSNPSSSSPSRQLRSAATSSSITSTSRPLAHARRRLLVEPSPFIGSEQADVAPDCVGQLVDPRDGDLVHLPAHQQVGPLAMRGGPEPGLGGGGADEVAGQGIPLADQSVDSLGGLEQAAGGGGPSARRGFMTFIFMFIKI